MLSKSDIKKLLKEKKFAELFSLLNLETEHSFIDLLIQNECLHNSAFRRAFWKEYFPNHTYFNSIISNDQAVLFIESFLKQYKPMDSITLKRISRMNARGLVTAIRYSRSFLNEKLLKDLSFWEDSDSDFLKDHLLGMKLLHKKERNLNEIARKALIKNQIGYVGWLYIITFDYLYNFGRKENQVEQFKNSFIDDYSRIMAYSYLLSAIVDEGQFDTEVKFLENLCYEDFMNYSEVITKWLDWYNFFYGQLDNYANDENMEVRRNGDMMLFYPKDLNLKALELEENLKMYAGMAKWHKQHLAQALKMLNVVQSQEKFSLSDPTSIRTIISDISILYNQRKAFFFMSLYGIQPAENSALWRFFNSSIVLNQCSEQLLLTAFKYVKRSEQKLWFEKIKGIFSHSHDTSPILNINHTEWLKLFAENIQNENSSAPNFLNDLIFKKKESSHESDKDKPHINLLRRPFLLNNNVVYAPRFIFNSIDLIWSFLEFYLNSTDSEISRNTKSETARQEQTLMKYLQMEGVKMLHGISIKNSSEASNGVVGEIDILLWQDDRLMLVEVKRSKLRLNHHDRRVERLNLLPKAKGQLRKLIDYIRIRPDCLEQSGISQNVIRSANITGLILTMNTHGDRTRFDKDIYKTSFPALPGMIVPCRKEEGNKLVALIKKLEEQYDFYDKIKPQKNDYEFGMIISK